MNCSGNAAKKRHVSRIVLDASAVLAMMYQEPGGQDVAGYLSRSLLSAVNLSEVVTKLADSGMTIEETHIALSGFPCEIVPFDGEHAYLAASLRALTRPFGFSLGDRACLALGLSTGFPVVTAERAWEKCDMGVKVIRIR
jgi:ribonuclease VapC